MTSESKLRVLVADDNHDAADTLSLLLDVLGHDVQTVYDGGQAVRCVRSTHDLVVLDIAMPVLDGYRAAEQIRNKHPAVTIAALTGCTQPRERERALSCGFDIHLAKPLHFDTLRDLLARVTARRLAWPDGPAVTAG